jgi:hypothetical protein
MTFSIDDWQSVPHNKNQNFAKRGWQDTKLLANKVLDHSGAPSSAWFLALSHMCFLLNHVTRKSLNWCTPIEWLLGFTPDISVLLAFIFWEPVYYKEVEPSFTTTPEKFGRFAGISAGIGHLMTFIIYIQSGDLIHQSSFRIRVEDLDSNMNYTIPETRAAIEERIPEESIQGAINEGALRSHSSP